MSTSTSTSRADILGNIRRSLHVTGTERPRVSVVAERLAQSPQGPIPARGQLDHEAQVELFKQEAERIFASVVDVASVQDVPAEVARFLREANLPATLRMGSDPRLAAMPWTDTALALTQGRSDGDDLNAISHAFAGIAETGTLALVSGADNPTTLNFLPDNHIVVIAAKDITGDLESVWARLRTFQGKGEMPRTVNLITGPSRSGDIEQTMLLGAHGPRRLHIVIVRD